MKTLQTEHLTLHEQTALEAHEAVIEQGIKTFYAVGTALLAIRDERLYREHYPTFEAYCRERWDFSKTQANRLIQSADVVANLTPTGVIPEAERHVRPLTTLEPEAQRIVWEVVQQTAPDGRVTAAHVQSVANVFKEVVTTGALDDGTGVQIRVADVVKAAVVEETYERMQRQALHIATNGTPKALQMSASNEWYTPALYIEGARAVMGSIDLDPASSDFANKTVQAAHYYTLETNGFNRLWNGRVWLNPPYGRNEGDSNQELWSARLIEQYQQGITQQAVLLVNAVTDCKWFQPLWDYPICFTRERIRFYNADGESNQPTHGNVFVYFGPHVKKFAAVFNQWGRIAIPQGMFNMVL